MKFNKAVNYTILSILVLTGCAHRTGQKLSSENSPDLAIQMFKNDSFQPGLEEKLTNLLIEEFLADGRANIEDIPDADFLLSGRIHTYQRNILSLDGNDDVNLYQLVISVDIIIRDIHSTDSIASINNIQSTTTYVPLRSSIEYESEKEANQRLLEDLSNEIVYRVLDSDKRILTKK